MAGWVLTGCTTDLKASVPLVGKPADPQAQMAKVFGPIETRMQAGDGWVVLSPTKDGARYLGYMAEQKDAWQALGKRYLVEPGAAVRLEGNLVVVQSQKDYAPQFAAYRYGVDGLAPVDYYASVAPEATVKTGQFVLINKDLNVLYHYQDGKLVKTYRVATGRDTKPPAPTWQDFKTNFFTPEGNYRLTNFVENPPFNALKPGDISYAGGASGNPLGTRWMGFTVLDNDNAWIWGIHGTSHPELIGTWASDGCIRMYTKDAEELFSRIKGKSAALRIVGK